MTINHVDEGLSQVDPSRRVLLLSHCLRPSQSCPGKFNKQGLMCSEDCLEDCVIRRLREVASRMGYKGTCVAAGGAMALRFIKEHNPLGIVAVACDRELSEGVEGVKEMTRNTQEVPAIVIVPLTSDGCVDTEVDEGIAISAITLGCSL
jgi:geranylgeranyl diphosphate synthase type II